VRASDEMNVPGNPTSDSSDSPVKHHGTIPKNTSDAEAR
jgi:hypothetical protein